MYNGDFFITMETKRCIELLRKNRKAHVEEYANQLTGWKLLMSQHSEEMLDWAQRGGNGDRPVQPSKPKDFQKDYDWLIGFLIEHIHDTVEVSSETYDKVVRNEFSWKDQFLTNSTLYSSGK